MCGLGGSSSPTYIPVAQSVQATAPSSVDANKAVDDANEKIKKQLAAKTNTENNTLTSPLGASGTATVNNKTLLGE